MKIKMLVPALLLSVATVAAVTPASANWFHNKYLGISRNVGSAPNPTPDDVRQNRLPIVVREQSEPGPIISWLGRLFRGQQSQPVQTAADR
jgi:hypothetical protein